MNFIFARFWKLVTVWNAKLTKKSIEAFMAVRFLSFLLESAFVKLFQAKWAYEMLRVEFSKHGGDTSTGNGFGTSGTKRTLEGVKMRFAVSRAFMLEKVSVGKRLSASITYETIRVPLSAHGRNVIFRNGYRASSAFRCELSVVAIFAKGLIIFFVKSVLAKRFVTIKTYETIRMPCAI